MSNQSDIQVEGHPGLVRRAGVIVNVDKQAYLDYMARKQHEESKQQRISDLESQVAEMSKMIQALVNKGSGDEKKS